MPKLFSNVLAKKVSGPHTKYHMIQRTMSVWLENSPGKNTGVGCHALLQAIFPTQGWNPGLPHCRRILHRLSQWGSLFITKALLEILGRPETPSVRMDSGKQRPHLRAFTPQLSPPRAGWDSVSSLTCPGSPRNHQPPGHRETDLEDRSIVTTRSSSEGTHFPQLSGHKQSHGPRDTGGGTHTPITRLENRKL